MNPAGPSFSICIPTYNRGKDFYYTIQSVINQSFPSWELIITDDSTNDETAKLIQGIGHPRVRYYKNETRLGLVRNWNHCMSKASKEYILLLHHDDFLLQDALKEYAEYLVLNTDAGFLHANSYGAELPAFKKFNLQITQDKPFLMAGDEAVLKSLLNHNFTCSTVVISKNVISELGLFDTHAWVSPDFEYYARIGQHYAFHHLSMPAVVYVRHRHNTHISGYNYNDFYQNNIYYLDKVLSYIKEYKPELKVMALDRLNNAMVTIGNNLFLSGKFKESFHFFKNRGTHIPVSLFYKVFIRVVMVKMKNLTRKKFTYGEIFELSKKIGNQNSTQPDLH